MKPRFSAWSLVVTALVLAGALTVPVAAGGQRHNTGGSSGGGSGGSSGGGSGGSSSGGSGGSSGGGGQSRAVPRGGSGDSGRSSGGQDRATPRDGDRQGGSSDPGSNTAGRRRGDEPRTGTAVVRTSPPRDGGDRDGGGVIIIRGGYRGFNPWYGYGGYYGGYYGAYDPWFGWYPTYGSSSVDFDEDGALKLKVKPAEAAVYVDGYYVGIVDDFDGLFQRLPLEPGPHRIEIRAPEYQPLSFDVMIEPDHTTTFRGELVK